MHRVSGADLEAGVVVVAADLAAGHGVLLAGVGDEGGEGLCGAETYATTIDRADFPGKSGGLLE
ncbi:hypothetical protein GCM10023205_13400 [Yinghuangia aomiensis]|uniref:Uncharacterized protein n=1 Tax=Yinghuangia aomiensis TaxID=676205 RepID=A0ABP9GUW3_9ACTN